MKIGKCKNCGAEIEIEEGRREREFCDNKGKCKYEWHKKNKKKEKSFNGHKIEEGKMYVLKDGKPILATTKLGMTLLNDMGLLPEKYKKLVVEAPVVNLPAANITLISEEEGQSALTAYEISEIAERIKTLELEINNPPKNLMIGTKKYLEIRRKELAELKAKISPTK